MDYPFNTDKTPYAYVLANQRGEYGHIILTLCLPDLARNYHEDGVLLRITSQVGGDHQPNSTEPFYAIKFGAEPRGGACGMSADACDRASKALRRINKAIEKIDALAGSPAVLIEDLIVRTINAAKVSHVYVARTVNELGCIPDMRYHELPASLYMRDNIASLKRETLKACGALKLAA